MNQIMNYFQFLHHCILLVYKKKKALSHAVRSGEEQNAVSAECCYVKGQSDRLQLALNDGTHFFTKRVTYV